MRVSETEISEIFQEAACCGDREWILDEAAQVKKLPQIRYFGLRLSYDLLKLYGKFLLQGNSRWRASRMAGISEGSAKRFEVRSNLPNPFRERRQFNMRARNLKILDREARAKFSGSFMRDLERWSRAALKEKEFANAREQVEYIRAHQMELES